MDEGVIILPVQYLRYIKVLLTCRKILKTCDLRLYFHPKEGLLRIFIALKIPSLRPGLNPRPFGPVASTLTTTPPRRLTYIGTVCEYSWVSQLVTDLLCRKSMMSRNINDRYQVSRSRGVGVSSYQLPRGIFFHLTTFKPFRVALGSLAVSVLAIGRKVRGLNRGRGRWTFKSYKTRSRPSFGGK
jgi:hypothetical protein